MNKPKLTPSLKAHLLKKFGCDDACLASDGFYIKFNQHPNKFELNKKWVFCDVSL